MAEELRLAKEPGRADVLSKLLDHMEWDDPGFEVMVIQQARPHYYVCKIVDQLGGDYDAIHIDFE